MKLHKCLANTPYRQLIVIARLRKIHPGRQPKKDELVDHLSTVLPDPGNLQRALRNLSPDERQALDALIAAGGRMPWPRFRHRFGDVRPYKPWRSDHPRHPWRNPASPVERLVYLGLIFRHPRRPRPGDDVEVLIPDDFMQHLPPVPPPADAACLDSPPLKEASRSHIIQDVVLFLSLLHRQDVQPLHERWLPPRLLHDLNQRVSQPEDLSRVRSELQTGRLRFLHFLAECASLLDLVTGRLAPSPQAWSWLEVSNSQRHTWLWEAWQARTDALRELWQRYRLPGAEYSDPLLLLTRLLAHLTSCSSDHAFSLTTFTHSLLETDSALWDLTPWWEQEAGRDRAHQVIAGLMTGPLRWWNVVTVENMGEADPRFTLTPQGRWLLNGTGDPPPDTNTTFVLEDDLTVIALPKVSPRSLVRLETVAQWVERRGDALRYQIVPGSLAHALQRGMSLNEIVLFLDQEASDQLTPDQRVRLEAWGDEIQSVRLHRVTVLETRTADQMVELTRHRRLRHCVRRTLSPRTIIVNEQDIQKLRRALRRLGIHAHDLIPSSSGEAADLAALDTGAATYLLTASRVYTALSRWIDLPQPLPTALLDDLATHLDPESVTAANQVAADVVNALAQVMDGWTPQPMPGGGLSPEEVLPHIEEAIHHGQLLDITYWTAGRGELNHRTVEPYRIEWQGEVPYLIGYCHERQDERVFRIDRIQQLHPTDDDG